MKQIIYISGIVLCLTLPRVALAESNQLSNVDFKQLACSYMADIGDKQEALTELYSDIQSVITDNQKETLEKLATNQLNANNYCNNVYL
jgi:hypothetical protein